MKKCKKGRKKDISGTLKGEEATLKSKYVFFIGKSDDDPTFES